MSHGVLDIVAVNPQIQHVAQQVQPTAVHEHRREYRGGRRNDCELCGQLMPAKKHPGNQTQRVDHGLTNAWPERDLPEKDQRHRGKQRHRDDRPG